MPRRRKHDDYGYEEDSLPKWRPKPVEAEAIPASHRDQYRDAGYFCTECSFSTSKTGFSGKQAMRAHSKKHVNERRATDPPGRTQLLWLLGSIAGVILVALFAPTVVVSSPVALAAGFGAATLCVLLGGGLYWTTSRSVRTSNRSWIRLTTCLLNATRVAMVGTLILGMTGVVAWYWLIALPLLMLSALNGATGAGYAALQAKRGNHNSSRYSRLIKAKTIEADNLQYRYRMDLRKEVLAGKLNPKKAGRVLKRRYELLGLFRVWDEGVKRRKQEARDAKAKAERRKRQDELDRKRKGRRRLRNVTRTDQGSNLRKGKHRPPGSGADGPEPGGGTGEAAD